MECVNVRFNGDLGHMLHRFDKYIFINSTKKVLKKQMIGQTTNEYFETQRIKFLPFLCQEPVGIRFSC